MDNNTIYIYRIRKPKTTRTAIRAAEQAKRQASEQAKTPAKGESVL